MKKILSLIIFIIMINAVFALPGDINQDGIVDGYDLIELARSFGSRDGDNNYDSRSDISRSGSIDGEDLSILAANFGRRGDTAVYGEDWEYVPGEVVVSFYNDVQSLRREELLEAYSLRLIREYQELGVMRVSVPNERSEHETVEYLNSFQEIEFAELNYIYRSQWVPNDPYFPYQWHFSLINLRDAWDISRGGSPDVIIAVIDSGIAYEDYGPYRMAPDLAGTRFTSPYNFIDDTVHANDQNGHGTHVAGTIAQTTDNAYGVAGIAFNSTIMPLKVLDASGSGSTVNIARAIIYARENGANIINMSLGGGNWSSTVNNAVQDAYRSGIVLIAATGNDASEPGYTPGIFYPARYNNVIAVGAVRYDKSRSYYSNYGEGIDLVAPGGDIRVDQNNDSYPDGVLQQTFHGSYSNFGFYFFQGTSMAAPHVTGIVALIMSVGVRDPEAIYNIITQSAIDLGTPGYNTEYGYGLIDAFEALNKAIGGMGWAN